MILEIVPDQNAELVRLQAGQFDMLQQQVRARRHRHAAAARASRASCKLIELGVSTDPDSFFFNLRSPYWAKDPRRDWITRKEFRQAISHAVDREAFAEHRVPRRRRADLGTGHARQPELVLAQRAALRATRSSARRRSWPASA